MRIRTLAALTVGAALGAGGSYLLDPDHGPQRRREALRQALTRATEVDWSRVVDRTVDATGEIGRRAAQGYREGAEAHR